MKRQIVLASKSPRRNELLKQEIDDFIVDVAIKPEKHPFFIIPSRVPLYLAKQKVKEVYKRHKDALIIGADTIVLIDNNILGKPKDKEDAKRMISMLQGKTHQVITGVYLKSKDFSKSILCKTDVTFKEMTNEEIDEYCNLETIYDKAGAYAIQGEAHDLVTKIKGSYNNVVGLPIELIKDYLK